MNIEYVDNIGECSITSILEPTGDECFYKSIDFRCTTLTTSDLDCFTKFLDEQITLSHIVPSCDVIILVHHNSQVEPAMGAIEHFVTFVGSRVLSCKIVRWGFVSKDACEGYVFTIFLPTTHKLVSVKELFASIKTNGNSAVKRIEVKPRNVWGRVLVWLSICHRRFKTIINGVEYDV